MVLHLNMRYFGMLLFMLCLPTSIWAQKEMAIDKKGTLIEVRNTITSTSATAPTNPLKNDVWFDTTAELTKIYNGTTWLTINADALNKKEDSANKSTNTALSDNTDTKFPTEKAVKTYVDDKFSMAKDHDWYKADTTSDIPNAISNHIWTQGKVGIGSNQPTAALDVKGTGLFREGNTYNSFTKNQLLFSFNGTARHRHAIKTRHQYGGFDGNAIDFFLWKDGDTPEAIGSKHVMSMTGAGRVGINTTAPESELDVKGTGLFRKGNGADAYTRNQLLFSYNYATNYKHALKTRHHGANSSESAIDFYLWKPGDDGVADIGSKQVMSMTSAGRVGIGTTLPESELDVKGTGLFRAGNNTGTTKNQLLFSYNYGLAYQHAIKTRHSNSVANNSAMDFYLWQPGNGSLNVGSKQVMSMTGAGRVGIGATAPETELDVKGTGLFRKGNGADAYTSNQLLFSYNGATNYKHALKTRHHGANSSESAIDFYLWKPGDDGVADIGSKQVMSMTSAGRVGIGTKLPTAELDVVGTGVFREGNLANQFTKNQLLFSFNGSTNHRHAIKTRHHNNADNGNAIDFYLWKTGDAAAAVGSKQVMSMTGAGRVGIGTTIPAHALHVVGDTKTTGSFITSTSTYPDYVFDHYVKEEKSINSSYTFKSIEEIDAFIKKNKHLPGVTGIKELAVEKDGRYSVNLTQTALQTLEKVEELYLHTIEQHHTIEKQNLELNSLRKQVSELNSLKQSHKQLQKRLAKLEELLLK